MIEEIKYYDLPDDFFEKVIFYGHYISHSEFIDIPEYIIMLTVEGNQYVMDVNELRDKRIEGVIPFFKSMAISKKVEEQSCYYFDFRLLPKGWKYYYIENIHCFILDDVYQEYEKSVELLENNRKENLKSFLIHKSLWKPLLKQAYQTLLNIEITGELINIVLDEKIHVCNMSYSVKSLDINHILQEEIYKMKNADVLIINYITPLKGLYNLIDIGFFFQNQHPYFIKYEFERKFDFIDENEFMKKFMDIMQFSLGNQETGYSFLKAPPGYSVFNKDMYSEIIWIKDHLYQENYHNVIEPFINYSGNRVDLTSPIYEYKEKMKHFF